LHNGKPVLTIVNAPFLKFKFHAISGKGAFLNNKKIKISDLQELNKALVNIGRGTKKEDKEWFVNTLSKLNNQIRTNRTFGSTGLEISMCAAGITDAYINSGSQVYDYLPGSLIASEAGAAVLNFEGEQWSLKDSNLLIANKKLADDILKII